MKFLVIKHVTVEGLGVFEEFCCEYGITVDSIEKAHKFPPFLLLL